MNELFVIFDEGRLVSTKHNSAQNWINNSVIDVNTENNTIDVYLRPEYINSKLEVGEQIEVRTVVDDYIYVARGKVKNIVDLSRLVKISIDTLELISKNEDLRKSKRFDVCYNCIIYDSSSVKPEAAIVGDVSELGIKVTGNCNLSLGQEVFVDIFLNSQELLKLKGKIMRKKLDGYEFEYGINTDPVDENNKGKLNSILSELDKKVNEDKGYVSIIKKLRNK